MQRFLRSLWRMTLPLLVETGRRLVRSRELLWSISAKEIRIRYKQSLLGIGWAIFVPVAMMLIFTFIFNRVAKVDVPGDLPYPVFAYLGLLPWTFFSQSLAGSVTTLVTNRAVLTKIYFPQEVFPLAKIIAGFVDFLIASLVLVGLLIGFGVTVQWTVLYVLPLLALQVLFMIGCALLLSMANLFYRDVQYVFRVAIQLWMFATAVIYPIEREAVGETLHGILWLNPMTPILEGYRAAIAGGVAPDFAASLPAIGIILFTLWLGVITFDRARYLFAERV